MTALVLLPGMDGTGRLFGEFVGALGPTVRTVVVSYPTDPEVGVDGLAAVVSSRLPPKGPFVLLGESFSGPIAVSVAASAPPGLRGLVLCCSFVRNPRPSLRWTAPLLGAVPVRGNVIVRRALLGRFATPERRRALDEALADVPPATIRARLRAVLSTDVESLLARVSVPILCLRATEDCVVPRSAAERILRVLPAARFVDVEGPHLLLQSAPSVAARIVADFVREVTRDR